MSSDIVDRSRKREFVLEALEARVMLSSSVVAAAPSGTPSGTGHGHPAIEASEITPRQVVPARDAISEIFPNLHEAVTLTEKSNPETKSESNLASRTAS